MMQQLQVGNRFHSLAPDDPDNTDSDTEVISRPTTEQPPGDASSTGSGTEYFDVQEDAFYFQAKADQPPREPWDVAHPIDFNNLGQTFSLIHQIDEGFQATRDISNPLGMDDTGQIWQWADVGSSQMPREAPTYPTLTGGRGDDQPETPSRVNHLQLFAWITDHLTWLSHYDTVYVFVDNRELPGTNCPDHWPYFAPWIKGRCEVIGYRQERTTAIYVPISQTTGLDEVHYTWAGTFVLEALCAVYPTINFALIDSDCVPTALFEIADLVTLMTDQASRKEAMQSYTMASAHDCPPAVLLMTESRAELNAGLVIVTGHVPATSPDVNMEPEDDLNPKDTSTAKADDSDSRAHKARRIAATATSKSPPSGKQSFAAAELACWPHQLSLKTLPMHYMEDCSSRRCLDVKQRPRWSGHTPGQCWGMGRTGSFPHPCPAHRMAETRARPIPAASLHRKNTAIPHMGQTDLRAGSTFTHVNLPNRLSHPMFTWRQIVPE